MSCQYRKDNNINKQVVPTTNMQEIICSCGHKWDYHPQKIKNPLYCTCPRCNKKMRLREGQG